MNMNRNGTVEGLAGLGYPGFGSGGRRGVGGQRCISGHGAIYDRWNARGEHEALEESAIAGLGQR